MDMADIFLFPYCFAFLLLHFFQRVKVEKMSSEMKAIRQELNELKPKQTLRASSQELSQIWKSRSSYRKQQIAKQFISTILDEYERLSEKAYQRKPGSDGLIEDRDLLFP